jgi:hypothetical protein
MFKTWHIFGKWIPPVITPIYNLDWNTFDKLITYLEAIVNSKYDILFPLLDSWNGLLFELDYDPTYTDWSEFRPLRLTREEDWSDWLAHLIASSKTGVFAKSIFYSSLRKVADYASPKKVHREISHEGYRADLIVDWEGDFHTHIEVKVGDTNLGKTYSTSKALRQRLKGPSNEWEDYILLLASQQSDWARVVAVDQRARTIKPITWLELCIALRRGLISDEPVTWKAWAYAFVGAIEQHLIGFPGHAIKEERPFENLDAKIEILRKGLENES